MPIGEQISFYRKKAGLSQNKLAMLSKVSQTAVNAIESGLKSPTYDTLSLLARALDMTVAELSDEQAITGIPGDIPFPIMLMNDPVSAGLGEILQDGYDFTWINAENAPAGTSFALRVRGDSMEPMYSDGDVVFVKINVIMESGDIGVFVLNGDGYLKQLKGDKLISLNPKYKPITVKEFDSFYCAGKVLGKSKQKE